MLRERYAGDDELLEALVSLPSEACRYGKADEAIASADELYRRTVARYGSDNFVVDTASLLHGQLLLAGGRAADAVPALEQALAGFRRHVGEKNQNTVLAQLDLSEAYWAAGRKDDSARSFASAEQAAARDHAGEQAVERMLAQTPRKPRQTPRRRDAAALRGLKPIGWQAETAFRAEPDEPA